MAAWFSRGKAPKPTTEEGDRLEIPGGLWTKCNSCSAILYTKELERSYRVCPKCGYHFRLNARDRVEMLSDLTSFEELDPNLKSQDPLGFKDSSRYKDRIKKAEKRSGGAEAVVTGRIRVEGRKMMLGVFDFTYMGGSMGTVVGEKLTRAVEQATEEELPMVIVSASGGARMQEGIFSLMQMAKVTSALVRHGKKGYPYISVLADPTMGGVAASFAMLGDVIIAEPEALIGFAGPRVIEQTIRSKLPEGFQRSEFLREHGMVDMIVPRSELKAKLAKVVDLLFSC